MLRIPYTMIDNLEGILDELIKAGNPTKPFIFTYEHYAKNLTIDPNKTTLFIVPCPEINWNGK